MVSGGITGSPASLPDGWELTPAGHLLPVSPSPEPSCSTFSVGDTGPGGGIVFHKDASLPEGSQCFEAAPAGWGGGAYDPSGAWGVGGPGTCSEQSIPGATGTAIGTGEANTNAIVGTAVCDSPAKASAPWAAKNYNGGGLSDWFLPSKDELNQLYLKKATVGGFTADAWYFSSSQYGAYTVWFQHFVGGSQSYGYKTSTDRIRPVRAF